MMVEQRGVHTKHVKLLLLVSTSLTLSAVLAVCLCTAAECAATCSHQPLRTSSPVNFKRLCTAISAVYNADFSSNTKLVRSTSVAAALHTSVHLDTHQRLTCVNLSRPYTAAVTGIITDLGPMRYAY
eukprot:18487-Heterococcus_DN1.PRE.3